MYICVYAYINTSVYEYIHVYRYSYRYVLLHFDRTRSTPTCLPQPLPKRDLYALGIKEAYMCLYVYIYIYDYTYLYVNTYKYKYMCIYILLADVIVDAAAPLDCLDHRGKVVVHDDDIRGFPRHLCVIYRFDYMYVYMNMCIYIHIYIYVYISIYDRGQVVVHDDDV